MSETTAERETGARATESVRQPDPDAVPPGSRWRPIPRSVRSAYRRPRTARSVGQSRAERWETNMRQRINRFTRSLERPDRAADEQRARKNIRDTLVQLVMALLLLLLIAAATGRADIISVVGWGTNLALPERTGGATTAGAPPAPVVTDVAPLFRAYYDQNGGTRVFGAPISPLLRADGRNVQWFERARLEEWQENSGTPYQILGTRLGADFTEGYSFATTAPFESVVGARYFPETSQGVREPFLAFWEQNGGLAVFGLPISPEVQEQVAEGQIINVQYFERARLEYRPAVGNGSASVTVGPLGRIMYERSEARPIFPNQPGITRPTP